MSGQDCIFSKIVAGQIPAEKVYEDDLKECKEVIIYDWKSIGIIHRLRYALARLISSFL